VSRGDRFNVRVSRDGRVVAETVHLDRTVCCSTHDELVRLVAAYLVWREELLRVVESDFAGAQRDPDGAISRLASSVVRGPKRTALVSALVLGRLGVTTIRALEEITARRLRTRRDVVASQMAITALANVGSEARPILERLAEHRHRDVRRAAKEALEVTAPLAAPPAP
jgi:hypothetical protein